MPRGERRARDVDTVGDEGGEGGTLGEGELLGEAGRGETEAGGV